LIGSKLTKGIEHPEVTTLRFYKEAQKAIHLMRRYLRNCDDHIKCSDIRESITRLRSYRQPNINRVKRQEQQGDVQILNIVSNCAIGFLRMQRKK
jgi:hypothetical protein